MALIVQKYGGTSVGSPERIKNLARRVARYKALGHQVVVVVSAMSGETNRLINLAKEIISPIKKEPTYYEDSRFINLYQQMGATQLLQELKDLAMQKK